jgi:LuxR family maltose regulon positive regulatory protein
MPAPLLTTKLYIPPPRPALVPRPRLVERLNAGLLGKLILVSAPAGFGKTTLLSEWVHNCGWRRREILVVGMSFSDDGNLAIAQFDLFLVIQLPDFHARPSPAGEPRASAGGANRQLYTRNISL